MGFQLNTDSDYAHQVSSGYLFPDSPREQRTPPGRQSKLPPPFYPLGPYLEAAIVGRNSISLISGPSAPPHVYRESGKIAAMAQSREASTPSFYHTVSMNVGEIKKMLLAADKAGKIVWAADENNPVEIFRLLQRQINAATSDVHMLFGYLHGVQEQYQFFNRLLSGLNGATHLGLEQFQRGTKPKKGIAEFARQLAQMEEGRNDYIRHLAQSDSQTFIDSYLETGNQATFDLLRKYIGAVPRLEFRDVYDEWLETLSLAQSRYQVVATNLPQADLDRFEQPNYSERLRYESAEAFAIDCVFQQLTGGKDVVLYAQGSAHIEKKGLPKHIRAKDPTAKVVSINLNGGQYDPNLPFDQAVRELAKDNPKWGTKTFALILDGYRECDIVIHLPTGNRTIDYKVDTKNRSGLSYFIVGR